VLLVVGATPAAAHKHPTPVELDAPAVVQVRTDAVVNISLLEHNRHGKHIGLFQATYQVPLATASGFAVDPTGAVVTTTRVVNVDLPRANVYAINHVFHDRYGARAPLPADPYSRTTIADTDPNDPLNPRLQRCYQPNTADSSGGCVVATTRQVRVLPFVNDQKLYGNLVADVVYPKTSGTDTEVAVLRVGASSMPTVRLASSLGAPAYSILGFTKTPSGESSESNVSGHFTGAGKSKVKLDETIPAQLAVLRAGAEGGPVVGETGEVVGFLKTGDSGTITLVGPDKIHAALKEANVVPHSGPTDTAYEAASHNYKNALYTAALPGLAATLKLYPGHALANAHEAIAKAKAGTPADKTGKVVNEPTQTSSTSGDGSGHGLLLPGLIAGAAILLLVVLWLVLRRRPGRTREPAVEDAIPPQGPRPDQVVDVTAASRTDAAPRTEAVPRTDAAPRTEAVPRTDTAPRTEAGPRTEAPAPSTARTRAGSTSGGTTETRSRALAAASNSSPVLDLDEIPHDSQPSSLSVVRPCRVCGEATVPGASYCESCGYPTT
jgi:hypothetical protein